MRRDDREALAWIVASWESEAERLRLMRTVGTDEAPELRETPEAVLQRCVEDLRREFGAVIL